MQDDGELARDCDAGARHASRVGDLNAIVYVLQGGVAWRLLPNDLPPRTTVFRWFCAWRDSGLFETLNQSRQARRGRVRDGSP